MTDVDRYMLDAKLPVGKPWRAGREVWVYGLFAGRGRGVVIGYLANAFG